jgi:esterase/lipase superfamily enzyme
MLKLRDFLHQLGREVRLAKVTERDTREQLREQGVTRESEVTRAVAQAEATDLCGQRIHLLAHSMGNFVLQCALERLREFSPGNAMPRMFEHVFLAAADVDDTVLEHGQAMELVHQIGNSVAIYHNPNDTALRVSDYTKGNPDRLGQRGAARPQALHQKIYQVDCSQVVAGLTQHSYYTNGMIAIDIRQALQGQLPDGPARALHKLGPAPNMFAFSRRP